MSAYEREEVMLLLPAVFDPNLALDGVEREESIDPEMISRKSASNPAHGNTLLAKIADVKSAYQRGGLSIWQKRALFLRHAPLTPQHAIETFVQVGAKDTERDLEEAMAKIMAHVNRKPYPRW